MLRILIVTSDLNQVQLLINNVIGKLKNLKIVGILTNEKDLEETKKNLEFDAAIFVKFNYNYREFMESSEGVIVIDDFKTAIKRNENKLALSTNDSYKTIKNQIENFYSNIRSKQVRQQAIDILLNLGFNFKHLGTRYIVEAVAYNCSNIYGTSFENLERDIYPYLAKYNKTQVKNVKWSLFRAINLMYLNHTTVNVKKLENYFHLEPFQKPTVKQVIGTLTNNLLD